ncbi:heterokaryon incompatibility protein-domain-containing protein [Podospora didyma]|uniref:Heterokaryon incompatibility protein-domain-containing protein n=1 Tax=Podospora didyma TaxID=330526 RepID=A0AAE0NG29_9PEZI|nr:heterokaryon incompatibility protein-domain-containing protein [Podospora didyma]
MPSTLGLRDMEPEYHYQYSALPLPTSIRLVSIQNTPNENVGFQLSMRVVDLEDFPVYEALSYTWGRPLTVFPSAEARDEALEDDEPLPVLCDGKVLYVRRNLYAYLLQWRRITAIMANNPPADLVEYSASTGLRLPDEMWIDALCISQNDITEKGVQVALMGRIYRQTRKITVWLGPEDVFTRPALEILFRLASTPRHVVRRAREENPTEMAARCKALRLPAWDSGYWWSAFAFLQRAWFRRSWVIQELALAPDAQMQCGLLTFPWSSLANACINLTEIGLGEAMDMWAWFEISGPKLDTPLWDDEGVPIIGHSERLDSDRNLRNSQFSLLHLLDACRGCDSSDPRDKIYAFLDIASFDNDVDGESSMIVADYHLSAVQVYLEAAWKILLSSGGTLEVLSRQSLPVEGESESKVPGLSSWVPDWSTGPFTKRLSGPTGAGEWAACQYRHWTPSQSQPQKGKRLYDQPVLTVQGALVDTVVEVTDVSQSNKSTEPSLATLTDPSGSYGFSITKSGVVAARLPKEYPWTADLQEPGEVLWRTMVADTILGESPAPQEYHAMEGELTEDELAIMRESDMRYYERLGDGIVSLHADWSMDLAPQKQMLARAVYGLLRDHHASESSSGQRMLERPETPVQFDEFGLDAPRKEPTQAYDEEEDGQKTMAATLTSRRERISTGRAIFRTEENYLGNGPRSVLPGDQVWVLEGASTPIVLRPKGDTGRFVLVGEAYVHGIMRGEAFAREGFTMKEIELE